MKKIFLTLSLFGSLVLANTVEINSMKWTEDFEMLVGLSSNVENTLEGLDQNNNGIRDDVEYYVNSKYQNRPFEKAMFTKAAKMMQKIITLPTDKEVAKHKKLDHELLNIFTCRDYILYKLDDKELNKELQEKISFKGKVLNTDKRLQAYIAHKKLLPFHFEDLSDAQLQHDKQTCINQYNRYKNLDTRVVSTN
jgi:hypothetical protein